MLHWNNKRIAARIPCNAIRTNWSHGNLYRTEIAFELWWCWVLGVKTANWYAIGVFFLRALSETYQFVGVALFDASHYTFKCNLFDMVNMIFIHRISDSRLTLFPIYPRATIERLLIGRLSDSWMNQCNKELYWLLSKRKGPCLQHSCLSEKRELTTSDNLDSSRYLNGKTWKSWIQKKSIRFEIVSIWHAIEGEPN